MNRFFFRGWQTNASFNAIWTASYALRAVEHDDPEEAGLAFDIAVAGGIVFG